MCLDEATQVQVIEILAILAKLHGENNRQQLPRICKFLTEVLPGRGLHFPNHLNHKTKCK